MARVTEVLLSQFFRVLAIIIIIFIANILLLFFNNPILEDIVRFLNTNIFLIIFISLFFFLASLVWIYGTPLLLLSPIFERLSSAFLVEFLIRFIVLLDTYIGSGIGEVLDAYAFYIELIVFILVLLFGYISISNRKTVREKRLLKIVHLEQGEQFDGEEFN